MKKTVVGRRHTDQYNVSNAGTAAIKRYWAGTVVSGQGTMSMSARARPDTEEACTIAWLEGSSLGMQSKEEVVISA